MSCVAWSVKNLCSLWFIKTGSVAIFDVIRLLLSYTTLIERNEISVPIVLTLSG